MDGVLSFSTIFAGKENGTGTGFSDEVEEGMVSMEDNVLSGTDGCFDHSGRRYHGGLRTFFIHFDNCILFDKTQVQGVIGHGLEVSVSRTKC